MNGKVIKLIKQAEGLGQGDPLSAIVFLIAMIPLITILNNAKIIKGYCLKVTDPTHDKELKEKLTTRCINYADDINNLMETVTEAKVILEVYKDFSKVSGLEINLQKTSIVSNRALNDDEL